MKVLQIIQKAQRRGAEIFACQLSVELQKMGHKVDVVYLFDQEDFQLDFTLTFIPLHADQSKRFWDFKGYRLLSEIIKKGQYDVVQANAGDTLKYAAISKKLHGWKNPLVFRNANNMSSFIRNRIHKALNQWFLNQCDYFISVSENCRLDLVNLYPRAKGNSKTITIGTIDFAQIEPAKHSDAHPILINIGGLVPEKNQEFLVKVFAELLDEYPSARLWLLGDGPERNKIEQHIVNLHIDESVVLWGNRPDAVALLKASDLMVMPSFIEGLPGVILEAMSCKIPVIAANVGGISEVIHDGVTGGLMNGYDTKAYKNKIIQFLNDEKLRNTCVANAQELIQTKYLLPKIASRFQETYAEISGNQR